MNIKYMLGIFKYFLVITYLVDNSHVAAFFF